ncbi:MAG: ribosome biogenesis GTPase Der [Verrucomicrobiota bacterium]
MKPIVAIIGRPNVGKSALFNRICGKKIALVYDQPGVTRDRMSTNSHWNNKAFTLMDTGGIGLEDASGFEDAISKEVETALSFATDILFVVDGREGLNPVDQDIANKLRRFKQSVLLVVNKIDTEKQEDLEHEFHALGFDKIYSISAAHGRGMDNLMSSLTCSWPEATLQEQDDTLRIALVGRPNVGKSSLINAVLNQDRVIVSPIAGTTRDSVDVFLTYHEQNICFVDTAGMRRKTRVHSPLEQAMTGRSAHSINRAHICAIVIDAVEGVSQQEKKIAGLIHEANKPCLIIINKWDLAVESLRNQEAEEALKDKDKRKAIPSLKEFKADYEQAVMGELFFLPYAPMFFVSAVNRKNMNGWIKALLNINKQRLLNLPTGELNRLVKRLTETHPPPRNKGRNRSLKIFYASQLKGEHSTPSIALFVNHPEDLSNNYLRYIEGQIRKTYPLVGCPIKWEVRGRRKED